jgi:hypothetical protein
VENESMKLVIALVALLGAFVLVGMLIAPHEPTLRGWYLNNACPLLDRLSDDICAAIRRGSGEKAAHLWPSRRRSAVLGTGSRGPRAQESQAKPLGR